MVSQVTRTNAERVLIVEDEESTRSGLAELVRSWGYTADEACDGAHALERITEFRPTIIVSDLVMPVPSTAVTAGLGMLYGPLLGGLIGGIGSTLASGRPWAITAIRLQRTGRWSSHPRPGCAGRQARQTAARCIRPGGGWSC